MALPFPAGQERGGGGGRGITGLLSVGSSPSKDVLPNILGRKEIFPMARNLAAVRVVGQEAVAELNKCGNIFCRHKYPCILLFFLSSLSKI